MKSVLSVVQVVIAILVTLGVLLQTPKATGLGGTIGGGGEMSGGYRRRRGLERTMLRATAVLIFLFVVVTAASTYFGR